MNITPEALFGELLLETHGTVEYLPDAPIVADSRQLAAGVIFVAVAGTKFDSHTFITDAVSAGAAAVIHTAELDSYPEHVLFCRVSDSRAALSLLWRYRNDSPDEKLSVYGITGTNGKTTSAYLLRHLLNHAQMPCGLVSTVEFNDGKTAIAPTHTTPDPQTLFPLLRIMKENGLQAAAMELSSHSLAQKRLAGLKLNGAVFTNLTGDHLDFHGDMENYYQAKKLLFTDYIKNGGIAAINIDTASGVRLARELANERPDLKLPTFGRSENSGWRISESSSDINGCSFVLSNALQAFQVNFPLPGEYNISNLAGVLTLLLCDGVTPAAIDAGLSTPFAVPGRLEKLTAPNGANFFVDYAHTDDALSNVLATLKKVAPGKVIALFGAGGDRDKSKRPRMGKAASAIADMLIITSDNPRSEEPLEIMAEIASGIPEDHPFEAIVDRRAALRRAVEIADTGDIVLVAGKGHENYQEIKGVKHHFDDREELRQIFQELL
ncbi:MAG: UDP-N-acetylmuramoyl-L-alanyl-D-glutamate--2,6-diaminopimelate ligase [Lentisphaerae bacterium]|nr:UDP-N-acetylmuramoyl-L-alanyl-D-glutamate--2,6-diaminopimelate ligase [Lentisphaerota bacterium]